MLVKRCSGSRMRASKKQRGWRGWVLVMMMMMRDGEEKLGGRCHKSLLTELCAARVTSRYTLNTSPEQSKPARDDVIRRFWLHSAFTVLSDSPSERMLVMVMAGQTTGASATPNSPNFDIVEIEHRLDPTLKQSTWRPHHFWTSCPRSPPPRPGARRSLRRRCSTACLLRHTPRPTSWVAWPTGPTARTATGAVASSTATATTEVGTVFIRD